MRKGEEQKRQGRNKESKSIEDMIKTERSKAGPMKR